MFRKAFLFVMCLILTESGLIRKRRALYTTSDEVELLSVDNFRQRLYNQKHAWFIEFYVTWCGDCQRYAPKLKSLSVDIYPWRDLLPIGVIDCSVEINSEICRSFEVKNYPTLRYFHANYEEGADKLGEKIGEAKTVIEQRNSLINEMIKEQSGGKGAIYPNLLPYTHSDTSELVKEAPPKTKAIFLVFEKEGSLNGAAIAMDLHSVPEINIRYALKNNTELIKNAKLSEFPSLVIVENGHASLPTKALESREKIRGAILAYLRNKGIKIPKLVPDKKPPPTPRPKTPEELKQEEEVEELRQRVKKMGDALFLIDIETGMRYSFKREITRSKNITGERFEALKNYVSVLAKYFPFGKNGKTYFNELLEKLNTRQWYGGGEISSDILDAEKEDKQVFSSPPGWLRCRGSKPNSRRFPCGMWSMFHYLTISAWQQNLNNTDAANPKEVVEAMLGYVRSFLGCTDCSMHFQKMAKERHIEDVASYKEAVIWLWGAHNVVNERLAGDVTQDPEYPKVQFPTSERCPKCRNEKGEWDVPEVLEYLKNVYYVNLRYIGSDTRIAVPGVEGVYDAERYHKNVFVL